MAKVRYKQTAAAISIYGEITDQAAYRAAQKTRGRVMSNIRSAGRIDTGRMIAGVQVRKQGSNGLIGHYIVSSSAPYTVFQEFGTRAHGPRTASVMVFTPKGGGAKVFATWVRGVQPAYFMTRAFQAATAADALA